MRLSPWGFQQCKGWEGSWARPCSPPAPVWTVVLCVICTEQ